MLIFIIRATCIEYLKNITLNTFFFLIISWDDSYKNELLNFKDQGIIGDVWFGEDIMYKVVK